MYFKKIKCPVCLTEFDPMDPMCPHCGDKNYLNKDAANKPNIKQISWIRQIIVFAVGLFGFNILGTILSFVVGPTSLPTIVKLAIINFVSYALLFVGMGLIIWVDWKKIFKSFKHFKPFLFGLLGFAAIMTFSYIWNITLAILEIAPEVNENEATAESIVSAYPLLSIIVIGMIGPICEELTYRVGLFGLLKRVNKSLAYLVTICVFAFIHFSFDSILVAIQGDSSVLVNELLNLPFYFFAGATFTFLYDKLGFAGSLSAHLTNNVFSVMATLLAASIPPQLLIH